MNTDEHRFGPTEDAIPLESAEIARRRVRMCTGSWIFRLCVAAWLFFACLFSTFAQNFKTWVGPSSGDWFSPTNWVPVGVPATNDIVLVSNATITLTAPVVISGQFNLLSGTLTGSPLTIANNGVLNIGAGVSLFIALTNQGTVNWQSGGVILYNNGSSYFGAIWNQAGGLWDIQCDQAMLSGSGDELFYNAGTMRKSAATGTTTLGFPLLNSGSVAVLEGNLNLSGGGTVDGAFSAAAGTSIYFNGGNFTSGLTPVLSGPGAIQLTGGSLLLLTDVIANLQMVAGTVSLGTNFQGGAITNLTLPGSTLSGNYIVSGTFNCGNGLSSGSLQVAAGGLMNWSGGEVNGPLTVSSNGVLTLGPNNVNLYAALTNQGTVNWQNGSVLVYGNSSAPYLGAIWNQAGGLWDIQCDQGLVGVIGTEQFHNAGTISKSAGTGTTTVSALLLNSGTVALPQGTLALSGGMMNTSDSILSFGISSTASFGQIAVSGPAALDGTVSASLLGGFVPALNNSFALVTYGSSTGLFTNVVFPPIGIWQTNYTASAFTFSVISISKLAFTAPPSGTNAGAILAPVVVQVQDANGNTIATNGVAVLVNLSSGSGTLSGTLTQLTDAGGTASFNDLSVDQAGSKTLQASGSAAGLAPATSSFTITAAAAAKLVLVNPITSPTQAGVAIVPAVVVQVQDQFGNLVPSLTPITARLLSSTGGGALAGGTNTTAYDSEAFGYFTSLSYNLANPGVAESVIVYFTSPGLTSVTNNPVMVDLILSSITLQDRNSIVQIDPTTEQGMFSWTVDGVNQVFQHWFWLRAGSNAPQISVDHFGTPWGLAYSSSNAVLNYFAQGMSVQLGFTLQGGSPGSLASDLAENLTIQNTSNAPMTLHLFAYSDFDLADNFLSDSVSLPATGTMVQQGKGMTVTENVQTPAPSYWEASFYAITLDDLDSTNPVTLSDSFIPPDPGDQTFAFQWDVTLGAGQSVVINLTNSIRPTPIQLNIASSGGSVVISWPTNATTGYQLFSTAVLPAGSGWSAVTNTMEVVGEQYQVTLPHSFSAQFYRLQK